MSENIFSNLNGSSAGSYQHSVPSGFPSPALDYLKEPLELGKMIVQNPLTTFYFLSEGHSMEQVIPAKALLVVDRSLKARNYDIVLALLNGEWTVRFIVFKNNTCLLVPANSDYEVTIVTEEMQLEVWAVVTKIIVDPKVLQHVCIGRL